MAAMTVEEFYVDYQNRRLGLVKALTTEVEQFLHRFNNVRGTRFVYGLPNETWDVTAQERPGLPTPVGIQFTDASTEVRKDWLMIIASYCDDWLHTYFADNSGHFNNDARGQLLHMINDLPTLQDVVNDNVMNDRYDDNEVRLETIQGLYNDTAEVAAYVSDVEEAPINEEVQQQEADDVNPVEGALNEEHEIEEPVFVEAPRNAEQQQQQEQEADNVNLVEEALNVEVQIKEPVLIKGPINAEQQQQHEQEADDVNSVEEELNEEHEIEEPVYVEEEPVFVEEEIDEDLCEVCRMERDAMAGKKCVLMTSAMEDNSRCPSCRFKKQRMR